MNALERAVPCLCGRGRAAELVSADGTVEIIACDACQDAADLNARQYTVTWPPLDSRAILTIVPSRTYVGITMWNVSYIVTRTEAADYVRYVRTASGYTIARLG